MSILRFLERLATRHNQRLRLMKSKIPPDLGQGCASGGVVRLVRRS
jgi:hypothetical protein